MSRSKEKGSWLETVVSKYLAAALGDDRIERRVTEGAKDRGDIAGFRIHGKRVVLECKNCVRLELSKWADEAETERCNDDADFAFVVFKRKGCGEKNIGKTYVLTDLETLAALGAGSRDLLEG